MPEAQEEWSSFLGRSPSRVDDAALASHLRGRTIAITGAGGFIGSALARRIAAYAPARLLLLDVVEHGLHDLELELGQHNQANRPTPRSLIVGDVCDAALLASTFARYAPQIVFHAAAAKHVWLMETNPVAAITTNVLGTHSTLQAAHAAGVAQFILVSTDKAVEPASIMGASKRLAELLVLASRGPAASYAVRLGNVLGSSGSVVPLFRKQLRQGRPLTITDPACSRYFYSIAEVVDALLAALLVDASTALLIPSAGRPQRVTDLAMTLIRNHGPALAPAMDLVTTGLRPGEKLTEAMTAHNEISRASNVDALRIVEAAGESGPDIEAALPRLAAAAHAHDAHELLRIIAELLPAYVPSRLLRQHIESTAGTLPA